MKKNAVPADRVYCQTPTPGKKGTTIAEWKFNMVRKALRRVIPKSKMGVPFEDLPELVAQALTEEERKNLGSVVWYTTTVKLHMETTGEIERIAGAPPQRIRRLV